MDKQIMKDLALTQASITKYYLVIETKVGRLDAHNVNEFRSELDSILELNPEHNRRLCFDLQSLTYMNSAILPPLIDLQQKYYNSPMCPIILICKNKLYNTLEILGFDTIFEVHDVEYDM